MHKLGIVVLAAGLARRMQGPNKLLMNWHGAPVLGHVISKCEALACDVRVIISHRDQAEVFDLLDPNKNWQLVVNREPDKGLSASLKLALNEIEGCDFALILLGDMPDVMPTTLDTLLSALDTDAYAIVPTYQGVLGNPVILGTQAIADCMSLDGDQGARKLIIRNQASVRFIAVDDPAIVFDLDEAADFQVSPRSALDTTV